jgi:hypothetical protein
MRKDGKWVFGWCVVGLGREIRIAPAALAEYGLRPGQAIVYLRGSRRSGGFSVSWPEKFAGLDIPLLRRSIGEGVLLEGGRIAVPSGSYIQPGQRLLSVRGSGYAVLFLTGGPIYEEALKQPEIETFSIP